MDNLTYKQAFNIMSKKNDANFIMVLVPEGFGELRSYTVKSLTFQDDELKEYDKALKDFKELFKKHFDIIFEGSVREASKWIGTNTGRGCGNFIVDDKYLIYTSSLKDNVLYDSPFYVIEKNGKFKVGYYENDDTVVSISDYGVRIK
jgi:hypothetical protein